MMCTLIMFSLKASKQASVILYKKNGVAVEGQKYANLDSQDKANHRLALFLQGPIQHKKDDTTESHNLS